jgi:hypothetical protein
MKITELKYTERKNLGNYEHAELSATALLEDGEDLASAFYTLKQYVELALCNELIKHSQKQEEVVVPEPVVEAPVKEKKTKAKKEKVVEAPVSDETSNIPAIPEEKPAKPAVVYNSTIAEHKSIFGGYLTKKYENSWKTSHPADEIKSFTASLNGKDFLDNDGKIVESFLNLVHGFFGA